MVYLSPNTAAPFAQFRGYNNAVRGMSGLGDFNIDLRGAINNGIQSIEQYAQQWVSAGRDAHIEAQNQAVQDMGRIVDVVSQAQQQSTLTVSLINSAQTGIRSISERFSQYCGSIGTARALQGARDVQTLALQIVSDMERLKATIGGTTTPIIDPTTGQVIYQPSSTGLKTAATYLPWILGAAFIFALPKIMKGG